MKVLDPAPREMWHQVCERCSYSTFFHTPVWAEVVVKAFRNLKIATKAYLFDDGTMAVLPLIEHRAGLKGFFRSYESMFPGVYGGLIADGELEPEHVNAVYLSLIGHRTNEVKIIGNPYARWGMPERFLTSLMFTQSLRLGGEFKTVWHGFSRGNKSNIRKALRSGLDIDLAESEDDYWQYYCAYQDSLRRWGERATSRYPFELFQAMKECSRESVKLWLIRKSGAVIGGIVMLYHNRHAVYWHGAFSEAFFEYRPSNLIHSEAIRDACERGYEWYDFNPSGGHEGVVRFKQSFHPQFLYFHSGAMSNGRWYRLYSRLRGKK